MGKTLYLILFLGWLGGFFIGVAAGLQIHNTGVAKLQIERVNQ